jgi:hypothetical protein
MHTFRFIDQGMLNKGLESFQLLLTETGGFNFAADVMITLDSIESLGRSVSVYRLVQMMQSKHQSVFPVISHENNGTKLLGILKRREVFLYLKRLCSHSSHEWKAFLRRMLPVDASNDDELIVAEIRRAEQKRQRQELRSRISMTVANADAFVSTLLFEGARTSRAELVVDDTDLMRNSDLEHLTQTEQPHTLFSFYIDALKEAWNKVSRQMTEVEAPSDAAEQIPVTEALANGEGWLRSLLDQNVDVADNEAFRMRTYPYK